MAGGPTPEGELRDGLWARLGDGWIDHHRAWRYKLYVPEFVLGGPSKKAIAKSCTTNLEFEDGASQ
eukprot:15473801-Alexandrium_andersonii.AAC.1